MFEIIERMVSDLNLNICETIRLPDRTETRSPAPAAIINGPAGARLRALAEAVPYGPTKPQLWNSCALETTWWCQPARRRASR